MKLAGDGVERMIAEKELGAARLKAGSSDLRHTTQAWTLGQTTGCVGV